LARSLPVLLLALASAGCVGFTYERIRDGSPAQVLSTSKLEPGKTTLLETIRRAGPPDLMLRAGHIDRVYYSAWDSDYFKFIVQGAIPGPGRTFSWDVFVQTLGYEDLHLARLEFGRDGVLLDVQSTILKQSRNGRYFALDNRIVSNYLEDKSRALALADMDDDDEDVEIDEPARKKKKQP
jgi:hypothetical protein